MLYLSLVADKLARHVAGRQYFDALTRGFRWNIPAHYNIGVDVCDRWAEADPTRERDQIGVDDAAGA